MSMPPGIRVIDTMMGLPGGDRRWWTRSMAPLLLDAESQRDLTHAAGYMYKDLPDSDPAEDPVETLLGQMDAFGIDIGMIPVTFDDEPSRRAIAEHSDRLVGELRGRSQPRDGGCSLLAPGRRRTGGGRRFVLSLRLCPSGADQQQAGLSDLRLLRRSGHSHLRQRRRARTPGAHGCPRRSASSTRSAGSSPICASCFVTAASRGKSWR